MNYPLGHVDCSIITELSRCLDETHFVPEVIAYMNARLIPCAHLQSDLNMTRQAMNLNRKGITTIENHHTLLLPYNFWMDK